jgi:hypothetical protein
MLTVRIRVLGSIGVSNSIISIPGGTSAISAREEHRVSIFIYFGL